MSTRRASRRLAGLVACLSVVPGVDVAAHAEPTVQVTTLGGTVVGVGDVIAVGQRSGSTCTFPDGAGVMMMLTSGSAATTLRIDDACRVSIERIVSSATDMNVGIPWSTEPKHPGSVPAGTPVTMPAASGSALDEALMIIEGLGGPKPPKTPEPVTLWTGYVVQTFLNAVDQPQWKDEIELDYAQGVNSGTIVTSSIGEKTDCAVHTIDPTSTYANTKSNCVYHVTSQSGPYAELNGSGDYEQSLVGQVLAQATSKEVFIVTKTDYSGSCPLPGAAPAGWSIDCDYGRK